MPGWQHLRASLFPIRLTEPFGSLGHFQQLRAAAEIAADSLGKASAELIPTPFE